MANCGAKAREADLYDPGMGKAAGDLDLKNADARCTSTC